MKKNKIRGNMVCFFNWAQYSIWHLYPDCKVSVDGRFRTAYPLNVLEDNFNFYYGRKKWRNILTNYNSSIVLIDKNLNGTKLLVKLHNWVEIYSDNTAHIFIKKIPENTQIINDYQKKKLFIPKDKEIYYWP